MKPGKISRRVNKQKRLTYGNQVEIKGSNKIGMYMGMKNKRTALVKTSPDYIMEVPIKNIEKIIDDKEK